MHIFKKPVFYIKIWLDHPIKGVNLWRAADADAVCPPPPANDDQGIKDP
jgi:hypothetical protein